LLTNGTDDKRAVWIATAKATIELLAARWPRCFAVYQKQRKPLKLGVHRDILAALDGAVAPRDLNNALRYYCGNHCYLKAEVRGSNPFGRASSFSTLSAVGLSRSRLCPQYVRVIRSTHVLQERDSRL